MSTDTLGEYFYVDLLLFDREKLSFVPVSEQEEQSLTELARHVPGVARSAKTFSAAKYSSNGSQQRFAATLVQMAPSYEPSTYFGQSGDTKTDVPVGDGVDGGETRDGELGVGSLCLNVELIGGKEGVVIPLIMKTKGVTAQGSKLTPTLVVLNILSLSGGGPSKGSGSWSNKSPTRYDKHGAQKVQPAAPPARPPEGLGGNRCERGDGVCSPTTADNGVTVGLRFATAESAEMYMNAFDVAVEQYENLPRHAGAGNTGRRDDKGHLCQMEASTLDLYFQYYGKMSNQYNMLQDAVRTSIYNKAILINRTDFENRSVMDVGAGSGILSFFAAQAGAQLVYAIEASSMSEVIKDLIRGNPGWGKAIRVVSKTVEELTMGELPECDVHQKVDVLVSEPIGTFLFNERMIETFLFARDKFLKPGGKMYPNKSRLYLSPFSDAALFTDVATKGSFWGTTDFYGISLEAAMHRASEEQFRQPVVDHINPATLATSVCHVEEFDFTTMDRHSLSKINFEFDFEIPVPTLVHGFAGWFDVLFEGSDHHVGFSTSPTAPPTHWYQIRFLLKSPLAVNIGQHVVGTMTMTANNHQSYYIQISAGIDGTDITSHSSTLDLKDPDYRYYSNPKATFYPTVSSAPMSCDMTGAAATASASDIGVLYPPSMQLDPWAQDGVAG